MSVQFWLTIKHITPRQRLSFVHGRNYSQRQLSLTHLSLQQLCQGQLSQRQPWSFELLRFTSPRPDLAQRRSFCSAVLRTMAPLLQIHEKAQSLYKRTYAASKSINGIIRSDYWIEDLPRQDFVSFLFSRFEKWPNNTAIVCDDSGRSYTYGQLMECSVRWSSALSRLNGGVVPECVALLSPNVPEYIIVLLGALAAGAYVTTIPTLETPAEIAHHLDDSGATVLVVDPTLVDKAQAALQLMTSVRRVTLVVNGKSAQGLPNFVDFISDVGIEKVNRVENSPEKVALILYSSGTTGSPKGVCLPHGSLSAFLPILTHENFFPFTEAVPGKQETSIGLMPFYHSFGLLALAASSFYLGLRVVCHPQPNPMRYAEIVSKYKPKGLHLVPPLLNFLTQSREVTQKHLASVRSALVVSAPVHPAIARAFKRKTHHKIKLQEGLGLTETLPLMLTPLSDERLGFCGKLMPNIEARVEDLTTRLPLGPGQPGELVVRGPSFFSHYHNNPEATEKSYTKDGWFRTGDVVTYNEDRFFSVVDRLKELIKVKAFQVSPTELEDLILQLDEIAEVGVVGVPDDRAGELPRAYVVLKDSQCTTQMKEQLLAKIKTHIKEKAAPYKQLAAGVVFIKELPKNPTGKLLRRQLKTQALTETKVQF